MNILVPDSWLRKFLDTKATPSQIKEYLSLCGPSVERIYEESARLPAPDRRDGGQGEPVYDIEITTNRPDAMSVFGIAREASVILPRFGIKATLLHDPYKVSTKLPKPTKNAELNVITDPVLNPRWTSIVLTHVAVKNSPKWLSDWLTKTGIRPINTVVDVTNYLMRAYGQPAHAFDYDRIGKRDGVPYMKLRASKRGEKLTTLDGKTHTLPGDDIVIEDGQKRLIDLCGIMGGENSAITPDTKNVILFLQTYEPSHIRKTSMTLSHRTEAAGLFEKGTDPELVLPALLEGVRLLEEIAGAMAASKLYDVYPKPYKPYSVSAQREKVITYLHAALSDKEISAILTPLGFTPSVSKTSISVSVPSFRRDVIIDVDIIEEIARIYGYHNIVNRLPEGEIPAALPSRELGWEEDIKIRMRDWGYTEFLTYSMISEKQMDIFGFDKQQSYKISNPLSEDWIYLRPHAIASFLPAFIQNIQSDKELRAFELSMSYVYKKNDLPIETPVLNVLWSGEKFLEAKGLAEEIFLLFGIDFQKASLSEGSRPGVRYTDTSLRLGDYASFGILNPELPELLGTQKPITRLYMNIRNMVRDAKPNKQYVPVPNHPASVEDIAFVVPETFAVGPLVAVLKKAHPFVQDVSLLDVHGNTRTLHITYLNPKKTLTNEEIVYIREKLLTAAKKQFGVTLKNS